MDELEEIRAQVEAVGAKADRCMEQVARIEKAQDRRRVRRSLPKAKRQLPPRSEPILAFVHVPKTAGSTVKSMFVGAYSDTEVRDAGNYPRNPELTTSKLSSAQFLDCRVTMGHVPYAMFREYLPPDTLYMTFMREPVDRVLSHYYRHRAKKEGRRSGERLLSPGGKITAASLEDALVLPQLSNLATRFLCGTPDAFEELPASALEDAKSNLREFTFVGIQERFEESLGLLQSILGLGSIGYENRHVSSNRPAVEEIPTAQRERILEHNALDAELYTYALELFERALADTPGFRWPPGRLLMFTSRHEQDLAEVRAQAEGLSLEADRVLEKVARVEKAQDRLLAARGLPRVKRPSPSAAAPAPAQTDDPESPAKPPLLAFVHIPKTAGGTVNSMFLSVYDSVDVGKAGNYMRSIERTTDKIKRPRVTKAKVAIGHVPLGVFRESLPPETRYMTFLREPVERVLSHYYRHIDHKAKETNSLEEALEARTPEICDLSTRFLSGGTSASEELPDSALDDAKANLREFAFVGIQERFEESVALLKRMLELGPVSYENQHVSRDRPSADGISPDQRRLILEHNARDLALYEYACGLFEQAAAEAGPGLAAEADEIRAARVVAPVA